MTSQNSPLKRILVIEDSEDKWKYVDRLLRSLNKENLTFVRATTVVDAETKVSENNWDLIVLDISLDITASASGPKGGGHATLGGLNIANKMFLLGYEAPTIVLTAFDTFPSAQGHQGGTEILGLEDVSARASDLLGTAFLGCIRYGADDWQELFLKLAEEALHE
ncbi:MAG: hypothetical protein COB46_07870 [Rhodospirillaceae bacterium]|nr:MAG: hypothetical protein COB46_07870 [Rhodospirillaceae bacterium]